MPMHCHKTKRKTTTTAKKIACFFRSFFTSRLSIILLTLWRQCFARGASSSSLIFAHSKQYSLINVNNCVHRVSAYMPIQFGHTGDDIANLRIVRKKPAETKKQNQIKWSQTRSIACTRRQFYYRVRSARSCNSQTNPMALAKCLL